MGWGGGGCSPTICNCSKSPPHNPLTHTHTLYIMYINSAHPHTDGQRVGCTVPAALQNWWKRGGALADLKLHRVWAWEWGTENIKWELIPDKRASVRKGMLPWELLAPGWNANDVCISKWVKRLEMEFPSAEDQQDMEAQTPRSHCNTQ